MSVKEVMTAHPYAHVLQWIAEGKKIEGRIVGDDCTIDSWGDFPGSGTWADGQLLSAYMGDGEYKWEFRLAPRTIIVNGVEVPPPESEYPAPGTEVYVVTLLSNELVGRATFRGSSLEMDWLNRGLIYLKEEDAIARAKAMLITKDA